MERQEGYYWVNWYGAFQIGKYDPILDAWYFTGNKYSYKDTDFDFINENRIKAHGELPD